MHVTCEPPILYFGTPVVLVSTLNEDGSPNLAPMSSAFWLGWRCVLGLAASSKTTQNLRRTGACVLNLPHDAMAGAVDRIARTTGSHPVPAGKQQRGYVHVKDKFEAAGLTPAAADTVPPPRVAECPVQLEAKLEAVHDLAEDDPLLGGRVQVLEVRILRVHAHESILAPGRADRIDPVRWRPLIMSFQKFYGLSPGQPHGSRLADISEDLYRSPDVDRARAEALQAGRNA